MKALQSLPFQYSDQPKLQDGSLRSSHSYHTGLSSGTGTLLAPRRRREPALHRPAARCSARWGRPWIATHLGPRNQLANRVTVRVCRPAAVQLCHRRWSFPAAAVDMRTGLRRLAFELPLVKLDQLRMGCAERRPEDMAGGQSAVVRAAPGRRGRRMRSGRRW